MDAQKVAKVSVLRGIRVDRVASLHWTKVTQASVKLELQAPSLPCRRKMQSRYFEGNAQPEHHSNVEDFYRQIYFETLESVANSIVEHFNQKDYSMYVNWSRFFWKELWGDLSHKMSTNCVSSTQSLTLIPYEFSYLYWQNPIAVSGTV